MSSSESAATVDDDGTRQDVAVDVTANDLVAFVVEVAAFAVLATWGWRNGHDTMTRVAWAVGVTAIAALAWGSFAAPRARWRVPALAVLTKVVVLGAAVLAARGILTTGWWWMLTIVVVVTTLLQYVGPWSRT